MVGSNFQKLVGGLLSVALPTFGQKVTYWPQSGGCFVIDGVFDTIFTEIDPTTEEVITSNKPNVGIKLRDLPFVPERGDHMRIDEKDWYVTDSQEDGQGGSRLMLSEDRQVNDDE